MEQESMCGIVHRPGHLAAPATGLNTETWWDSSFCCVGPSFKCTSEEMVGALVPRACATTKIELLFDSLAFPFTAS